MSPLSLKRLFAGKGKSQPQLSALCIGNEPAENRGVLRRKLALLDFHAGEYARLTEQIPADHNYHELESLLAPEHGQGKRAVACTGKAT